MKKLIVLGMFFVLALVGNLAPAFAKTDTNTKLFAGKYNLVSTSLASGLVNYNGANYLQQISVSKSGAISATWVRSDDRALTSTIATTVTVKGKITKIKKKSRGYLATYSCVGSDGMKISGTIDYMKVSIVTSYTLKGKMSVNIDGTVLSSTIIGTRAP